MGIPLSKFIAHFFPKRHVRMLMLGLDAAGKTTILYRLKLGENLHTIPTVGFNCEEVKFKNLTFQCWDVGGQDKIRPLWHHYYTGTEALIYVVDCNDDDRMEESRKELLKILGEDTLRDACLLVYANKQDLPKALSTAGVADKLGLHQLRQWPWYIQPSVATTGDGLYEGLEWIASQLKRSK
eukprot:GCRY01002580.1.p1 GENE.GCRY01002580.1~~GCRY01002580.1.p1  ORF type:complete len:182 (-),score=38.81 GCRY01002580.1:170-715(-)